MSVLNTAIAISDNSQIGEARRRAIYIASTMGFSDVDSGRAAIVASELATNISRYSTAGEILLRGDTTHGCRMLEILAIDRGPGISDVPRCMVDGYSTGGTPGNGLGAVRRLSSTFDIFSAVGTGTVVFSTIHSSDTPVTRAGTFLWGVICRPVASETACGDIWCIADQGTQFSAMIADGLGHGPEAESASQLAAAVFDEDPFRDLVNTIQGCHVRMQGSRGAAVAILQIDEPSRSIKYIGVGNIAGSFRTIGEANSRGMMSHNGIVGVQLRKSQQITYDCSENCLVILHSDGLQSRWSLDVYPGLSHRHPAVIAGVLYRDFCRGRDDVTVVVIRMSKGSTEQWNARNP